jgi:hypothetical protein
MGHLILKQKIHSEQQLSFGHLCIDRGRCRLRNPWWPILLHGYSMQNYAKVTSMIVVDTPPSFSNRSNQNHSKSI